jgi:5-methylcytosine-specific restriction protein A
VRIPLTINNRAKMLYRVCRKPNCRTLIPKGYRSSAYCPQHATQATRDKDHPHRQRDKEQDRPSASARGYGAHWQRVRGAYLARHPFCEHCARRPSPWNRVPVPARVVDHIVPATQAPGRFFDESNWQALCVPCHNRKTAREMRERN